MARAAYSVSKKKKVEIPTMPIPTIAKSPMYPNSLWFSATFFILSVKLPLGIICNANVRYEIKINHRPRRSLSRATAFRHGRTHGNCLHDAEREVKNPLFFARFNPNPFLTGRA